MSVFFSFSTNILKNGWFKKKKINLFNYYSYGKCPEH